MGQPRISWNYTKLIAALVGGASALSSVGCSVCGGDSLTPCFESSGASAAGPGSARGETGMCSTWPYQVDDTRTQAFSLGRVLNDEAADEEIQVTGATLSEGDHEDWYYFGIADEAGWNDPVARVGFTTSTAPNDYEVSVYYECHAGATEVDCSCLQNGSYTADCNDGDGCTASGALPWVYLTPDCDGRDDSGNVFVRVRRKVTATTTTCEPYTLIMQP